MAHFHTWEAHFGTELRLVWEGQEKGKHPPRDQSAAQFLSLLTKAVNRKSQQHKTLTVPF